MRPQEDAGKQQFGAALYSPHPGNVYVGQLGHSSEKHVFRETQTLLPLFLLTLTLRQCCIL
jgi:hypothetical protein